MLLCEERRARREKLQRSEHKQSLWHSDELFQHEGPSLFRHLELFQALFPSESHRLAQITEWFWNIDVDYSLQVIVGPSDARVLVSRSSQAQKITTNETSPYPLKVIRDPIEVDITWLLQVLLLLLSLLFSCTPGSAPAVLLLLSHVGLGLCLSSYHSRRISQRNLRSIEVLLSVRPHVGTLRFSLPLPSLRPLTTGLGRCSTPLRTSSRTPFQRIKASISKRLIRRVCSLQFFHYLRRKLPKTQVIRALHLVPLFYLVLLVLFS